MPEALRYAALSFMTGLCILMAVPWWAILFATMAVWLYGEVCIREDRVKRQRRYREKQG